MKKGYRAYHIIAKAWYPGESTPGMIITCGRFFAENQKKAREMFLEECVDAPEGSKNTCVAFGGGTSLPILFAPEEKGKK